MTSLHIVICGLGPPIKNPGYAYGRQVRNCVESFIELGRKSELFQDPNETIFADNLNYLKEEEKSTFTETTGKDSFKKS